MFLSMKKQYLLQFSILAGIFASTPLDVKTQICIGNAKIEKLKTWPHSKIVLDQGHVLGNTNFSSGRQICVFTRSPCFFLRLKMAIVFFK